MQQKTPEFRPGFLCYFWQQSSLSQLPIGQQVPIGQLSEQMLLATKAVPAIANTAAPIIIIFFMI